MRRLFLLLLCAGLAVPAAAAADGEPKHRIVKADQAAARAMLVQRDDLAAAFKPDASRDDDDVGLRCAALDESDLTLTGEAESQFSLQSAVTLVTIGSVAQLYKTLAQANASWRRGTSPAGIRCAEDTLRKLFRRNPSGPQLQWLRRVAFPRVAAKTVAFRALLHVKAAGRTVPVYFDIVALQSGRAHLSLLFSSAVQPVDRIDQLALARLSAVRMAKATPNVA